MDFRKQYDVIIIGGGHAGTEAALASARLGADTLLLTQNIETLGQMSCNPAIGGIGKGHLVREIDALDGVMAHAADHAGIHFRTLNASKGPAVRATRAQADRQLYKAYIRHALEQQPNLSLFQQSVDDLTIEAGVVRGVVTAMGLNFRARCVVLTAGTFLGGIIHIGLNQTAAGRAGDPPANRLAKRLRAMPFTVTRLKTGTPPRIDGRTVDYSLLQAQHGDQPVPVFSFTGEAEHHPHQVPCYLTETNPRTHAIIQGGLDRSPMYQGIIEGTGPRYCPSIEDKVVRYANRDSHRIFIEPEGLESPEIYPNGISTSLPFEIQQELVHSIRGFERAHITRPGYAIEYDFFDPRDLNPSLETKSVAGLFFAGQINGTTGYEEAAAQGLIAGLNAARKAQGLESWCPRRDEAYIGVMIDDLVTRGADEPYRMFTSRAEYRLNLREDNADLRLTSKGRALGLVDARRWSIFKDRCTGIESERARLTALKVKPGSPQARHLEHASGRTIARDISAMDLLAWPGISYQVLIKAEGLGPGVERDDIALQLEVQARYRGYIERQKQEIAQADVHDAIKMPATLDYAAIKGLSNEVREKLTRIKPGTLAQAGRIPGITPAALSLLRIYLKKLRLTFPKSA